MRLGEILIERKLITPDDLARALDIQKERGGEKLGKIMVDLGFIAMRDLVAALAEQLQVPVLILGSNLHLRRCALHGTLKVLDGGRLALILQ